MAEDREILPSSKKIFNENEEIFRHEGVDETCVVDDCQNTQILEKSRDFETNSDIVPLNLSDDNLMMMPEIPSENEMDSMCSDEMVMPENDENLEVHELTSNKPPPSTPTELDLSQNSENDDKPMIPNNDLSKFDDFCDEIRDLAFQNSQHY